MDTTTALVLGGAVIVIAILAWYFLRERRTKTLRSRFGPEYDHAVRELGGQTKAEDALERRQRRMEKIHIRPLPPDQRERFAEQWHDVQARFVDDPEGSIAQADTLVNEVMQARGYPM